MPSVMPVNLISGAGILGSMHEVVAGLGGGGGCSVMSRHGSPSHPKESVGRNSVIHSRSTTYQFRVKRLLVDASARPQAYNSSFLAARHRLITVLRMRMAAGVLRVHTLPVLTQKV